MENKKKKTLKILLVFLVLILAAGLGGGWYYLKNKAEKPEFFGQTKINGQDVSGKTPEQVLEEMVTWYESSRAQVYEKGEPALGGSLADFGYNINKDSFKKMLDEAWQRQRDGFGTLLTSLLEGSAFTMKVPYVVDEKRFYHIVRAQFLKEERVASRDAYLSFDEENRRYQIIPEVYGNELNDAELQELVGNTLNSFTENNHPGELIPIDIPEEMYTKPQVFSDDPEMNAQCSAYNKYCGAEITYQFGSQTQVLGWDTIRDWVRVSDGSLDEEKVYDYVVSLEEKYNTRYHDRTFHTSFGTDIVISGSRNEYGYTIDESGEYDQLLADIRGNAPVQREPVYYTKNSFDNPLFYQREGTDDLAGTYVEVSIQSQHLWFYKHGFLILESDIVSGNVSKGHGTQTGVFPLAYKESPSVLVGTNANDGYRTPVQYWMPFYEGQGLHDANWRGSFGGSIYQSNGSHGCVNLPYWAAEGIYNDIEAGVAIIIY